MSSFLSRFSLKSLTTKSGILALICLLVVVKFPKYWSLLFTQLSDTSMKRIGSEVGFWLAVIIISIIVIKLENKKWGYFGFKRPSWSTLWLGLLIVVVGFAAGSVGLLLQQELGFTSNSPAASAISSYPLWIKFLIVIRAGFTEEFMYRGYMMGKIEELFGSKFWAIIIPVLLFTLAHLSGWGVGHLFIVLPISLVLGLAYLWKKDIWANIFAHFMMDFIPVILVPLLLK